MIEIKLIELFFLLITILLFMFLFLSIYIRKIYRQFVTNNKLDDLLTELKKIQHIKENKQNTGGS